MRTKAIISGVMYGGGVILKIGRLATGFSEMFSQAAVVAV